VHGVFGLTEIRDPEPLRAALTVRQWLQQRGPCYPWSDQETDCRRVVELARGHAFEELPDLSALRKGWERAYLRWRALRGQVLNNSARVPERYQSLSPVRLQDLLRKGAPVPWRSYLVEVRAEQGNG
jgi:hypothetical protein